MAMRTSPAVEYSFETMISNVATDTTLGTATRHEFAAVTVYIPETDSRAFLSAYLEFTIRDAFTSAIDFDGYRLGVKVGADAWVDTDFTVATANTGDHEWSLLRLDVTDELTAGFSGASTAVQAAIAVATGSAANVRGITCKLVIVYEFDDASETTLLKTIRIPIQSHGTSLTTSHQEVGTVGVNGNNAPANQIPLLDDFLPEDSVTIRHSFIELWGNNAASAATDVTPYVQIDATTEVARAVEENALVTFLPWHDIFPYDTATHVTSAAHALNVRADVTARLAQAGGFLVVTYEFAASSSRLMAEAIVPLEIADTGVSCALETGSTTHAELEVYGATIDVPEENPTLVQSCAFIWANSMSSAYAGNIIAGGQSVRAYSYLGSSGQTPTVHRGDHGSGWTIARGENRLLVRHNEIVGGRGSFRGYAIVNYTCDAPAAGPAVINLPRSFILSEFNPDTTTPYELTAPARTPSIRGAYRLSGVMLEMIARMPTTGQQVQALARMEADELDGVGWIATPCITMTIPGDRFTRMAYYPITQWWNRDSFETGRMDIENARTWRWVAGTSEVHAGLWITHHGIQYEIAGTWFGYSGDGSGITVNAYDKVTGKLVGTTTTAAGGTYSILVTSNVNLHYAEARQDGTHLGRTDDDYPVEVA